ncbi:hypothetical protein BGX24_012737 [Mortierella sp. AD032]|nr:hypothetical protein BGX24_012737 [Mortierella sp. AD032]
MFHSQGGVSFLDSSKFLKELIGAAGGGNTGGGEGEVGENMRKLRKLSLRGHFSLQSVASRIGGGFVNSNSTEETTTLALPPPPPRYIPFCISTLAHLEIRPTVNSAVDLHLILDTAVGLRTLVVDSHGSFVDSNIHKASDDLIIPELDKHGHLAHEALMSLKIQHLKMSRQELEGVAARCPNLVEFQSVCSPATLWRQPIGSQQQQPHFQQLQQQQQQDDMNSLQQQPRSLVGALGKSCPKIQRFHVGLQQGGFHTDLVQDALTFFPRLVSLGLPTTDCTTATMDVIKSCQLRYYSATSVSALASSLPSRALLSASPSSLAGGIRAAEGSVRPMIGAVAGAFLTSLTIMNVSSSEKVSQALHEFLCWTPYLKEFYAYNTTLYLEHMQPSRDGGEAVLTQELDPSTVMAQPAATSLSHQDSYLSRRYSGSGSNDGGHSGGGAEHMEGVYVRVSDQGHLDSANQSETESAIRYSHASVTVSGSQPSVIETYLTPPPTITTTHAPLSSALATITATTTGCGQQTRRRKWACTGLETLVVRFAHLPWRNSAEPPKRSKETFAFLTGLQKLKRLCIKEGLMLEAGREYDMLSRLRGLEEVVFTTCYPIPIKPADMEWVVAPITSYSSSTSSSLLKKVVVRRQKASAVLDKEMTQWFGEQGCGVKLSLQLTDCCEEEYRFP